LVQSRHYSDYGEVIAVAVANLAVLQSEISEKGALVLGTKAETSQGFEDSRVTYYSGDQATSKRDGNKPRRTSGLNSDVSTLQIPGIFRLANLRDSPPNFAKMPSDVWIKGQEVPLDRWLFGQYNRLLPAKVSCRALAHLLQEKPTGVELGAAAEMIAEQATILGDYLRLHDEENDIGRDDLLSTAFPISGQGSEKSRQRYATQFVGSVNSEGQLSGLLVDLKLVNLIGRKTYISLTETGWHFATIENPVLDDVQSVPTQKFGQKEIEFLIDHIVRNVPAEDYAYRAILSAITDGADTPDTINTALQTSIPIDSGSSLSNSFLSTQRSGAISRMTDLGLVKRVRDGVRVKYLITELGKRYAQRTQ
jgi:hypothetical protein